MGLTSLPTLIDGSLGRVKADFAGSPSPDLAHQVPATEWNTLARAVQDVCEAVGLADGSTDGSIIAASRGCDYTWDPSQASAPSRGRFATFAEILERHVDHDLVSRVWLPGNVTMDVHDLIDMDRFELHRVHGGVILDADSELTSFGATFPRTVDCYLRNLGTSAELATLSASRVIDCPTFGVLWQAGSGGRVITQTAGILNLLLRGASATFGAAGPVVYLEGSSGAIVNLLDMSTLLSVNDFQGPGSSGVYIQSPPNARTVVSQVASGTQHFIEGTARALIFAGKIVATGSAQSAWLNIGSLASVAAATSRIGVPIHGVRNLLRLTLWADAGAFGVGGSLAAINVVAEGDDHDTNQGSIGVRDAISLALPAAGVYVSPRSSAYIFDLGADIIHLIGVRVDLAAGSTVNASFTVQATLEYL